ncbi:ATP-binding protein [Leifsonia soli]|uniref:Uncharacterized protein n=1 Tax=Leifsonia soli TaxID=582665 RepID=A0A852SX94_9MICO|nr:ATP-binding protein [Leifsonia soli]NYD73313.1 hypothetical protein [Leifsonia soli]
MVEPRRTNEVFVAGRYPAHTYNPRDARRQETELNRYLEDEGKALTVSGPSKSGKTVLLEHNLAAHSTIWINGTDLRSVADFWDKIIDWYGLYDIIGTQQQTGGTGSGSIRGQLGIPGVGHIGAEVGGGYTSTNTNTATRSRNAGEVAVQALRDLPVPIVIDDFHYVDAALKLDLTRIVKALIRITHVVMIAVPHEAFEAVRQEPDMNGRIWNLTILPWEQDELLEISRTGFPLLNLTDPNEVVGQKLSEVSMGAPFLMQQLCLDYCLERDIFATLPKPTELSVEDDWPAFFKRVADRIVPGVFDALSRGPRTHGQERSERHLKDRSGVTDIYGAILYSISKLGPVRTVPYLTLTHKIDELFVEAPQSQQVTSSLGHMANIARDARGAGDAALDYKNDELHILDPFLSFYLRYGSWQLPAPQGKR